MKAVLTILTIFFFIGCSNVVSNENSDKQVKKFQVSQNNDGNGSVPPPQKPGN